jgi:hypothetical protein
MADAIRSKVIRADVVSAYSHCPRKAFLLHCTEERGTPHEYQVILEEHTNVSRTSYLAALQQTSTSIRSYNIRMAPFHLALTSSRRRTLKPQTLMGIVMSSQRSAGCGTRTPVPMNRQSS